MKHEQSEGTMNNETLTTSQLAERIGVSDRTIQRAIKNGSLPVVSGGKKGPGNSARVSTATLNEYRLNRRLDKADILSKLEKALVDTFKRDAFCRDPRYTAPAHAFLGIPEPVAMSYLIHLYQRAALALTGESQPLPPELGNWMEILRQRGRRKTDKNRQLYKIAVCDISPDGEGNHDRL